MLLSVNVTNFRSCHNVNLRDTHDILALIGRNGVGKTNILKAIEWASKVGSATGALDNLPILVQRGQVELRIKLAEKVLSYSVKLEIDFNQSENRGTVYYLVEKLVQEHADGSVKTIFRRDKGEVFIGEDDQKLTIGLLSPATYSILSLVPDSPIVDLLSSVVNFFASVRYYPIEEIDDDSNLVFVSQSDYENWVGTKVLPKSANKLLSLKLLDLSLKKKEVYSELLSLLGADGLDVLKGISVTPFDIPMGGKEEVIGDEKPRMAKYYFFQFQPSGHPLGREFPFASLSFGTRRVVRLLTYLVYDRAAVSLIEQPEDGIHPGLLHKLIPILRSYANPNQFIITSHSPEVFNRINPDEVRLVDLKDGMTSVRALTQKELLAARHFMQSDGPLSEFIESVQEL